MIWIRNYLIVPSLSDKVTLEMIFLKRWKGILIFLYITKKGLAWFNMSFSEGNVSFCKHSVLLYRYYILFYILE